MRVEENEIVYSTKDEKCTSCNEYLNLDNSCPDCDGADNMGLIRDKDGTWYIDPALMGEY